MIKSKTWWVNGSIYTPTGMLENGCMLVDADGTIEMIGSYELASTSSLPRVNLKGDTVIPGMIDVHVHGGNGFHMMDGTLESIDGVSQYHAKHGTTSFLATTTTGSHEKTIRALRNSADAMKKGVSGAELLGVHLEGPYLNIVRCGAQDQTHIRSVSIGELEQFLEASNDQIRLVTIAPEIEGGFEAVTLLAGRGITVSIGHSNANFSEVEEAIRRGARHTTHHFNGMSPFHHRDPGVAGAGMIKRELTVELIADGIHVHPAAIDLLFNTKGEWNVCMITDAVTCAGMPDGDYGKVKMINGEVYLQDGSSLAGSSLTMIQSLKNVLAYTELPLERLLPSYTRVPARQAGVSARKGSLEKGKDADFVILDKQMNVKSTVVRGEEIYNSK